MSGTSLLVFFALVASTNLLHLLLQPTLNALNVPRSHEFHPSISAAANTSFAFLQHSINRGSHHAFIRKIHWLLFHFVIFPYWLAIFLKPRLKAELLKTMHILSYLATPLNSLLGPFTQISSMIYTASLFLFLTGLESYHKYKLDKKKPFPHQKRLWFLYRKQHRRKSSIPAVLRSKMNLTSFMTNPDWEGYISKLGCNKVSLLGQIGQIGRNSKFLFLAFNLLSIQSIQAQQCILADKILASPGLFYSTFTHVHSQATRLFSIDQRADIDLDQQFDFIDDDPFDFSGDSPTVPCENVDVQCLKTDKTEISDFQSLPTSKIQNPGFQSLPINKNSKIQKSGFQSLPTNKNEKSDFHSLKVNKTPITSQQPHASELTTTCLAIEVCDVSDCIVEANVNVNSSQESFAFIEDAAIHFGVDNCATQHICSLRHLFVGDIIPATNIGVKGINGLVRASGIGTIKLNISTSSDATETIVLPNVIYLPKASKNLISVTKWSENLKDDAGILSRGTYSIFLWNEENSTKLIHHPPRCKIPLMPVNESTQDAFSTFLTEHTDKFSTPTCLFAHSDSNPGCISPTLPQNSPELLTVNQPYEDSSSNTNPLIGKQSEAAQQPAYAPAYYEPGLTVKFTGHSPPHICTIISQSFTTEKALPGHSSYKLRILGSNTTLHASHSDLEPMCANDPALLPSSTSDIDPAALQRFLTQDEIQQLWNLHQDTYSDSEKLFLYWHRRLDHPSNKTIRRLAQKGILPKALAKVTKMPLCPAFIFAKAHKRAWRTKSKTCSVIRDAKDTHSGSGTSCNHIISGQSGIVPQSSGTLTHPRFGGVVLFLDHFSNFIYVHLISSPTAEATLAAKHAYKRIARTHGITIKRYSGDNSRFDEKGFKDDCHRQHQDFSYCGVGAHHANSIAEAGVKRVCYSARTLLLHAKRCWPTVIKSAL